MARFDQSKLPMKIMDSLQASCSWSTPNSLAGWLSLKNPSRSSFLWHSNYTSLVLELWPLNAKKLSPNLGYSLISELHTLSNNILWEILLRNTILATCICGHFLLVILVSEDKYGNWIEDSKCGFVFLTTLFCRLNSV